MPAKNLFFNTIFSAYYFLKLNLYHFSKIKSQKDKKKSRNQGFSYYFCMMIEGSGSGSRAGSRSTHHTSGSGSRRHKNMWIRWIRIRIRNTADHWFLYGHCMFFVLLNSTACFFTATSYSCTATVFFYWLNLASPCGYTAHLLLVAMSSFLHVSDKSRRRCGRPLLPLMHLGVHSGFPPWVW